MTTRPKNTLNARAFVTLTICLSGLGLSVTGIANHIYGFEPLSVERHAWMSAYNAIGLVFVAFSIAHVVFNRRALWKYFRRVAARTPAVSRELMLAGAVVTFAMLLCVGHAFHAGH